MVIVCWYRMTTTVKTIYGSDMRRFTITDEATSLVGAFTTLHKTIGDTYGLPAAGFALSFVDDEGDTCYMGSDTEMVEAVRFANKNASRTLKLIVTLKEVAAAAAPSVVVATPVTQTQPIDTNTTTTGEPLVAPPVGNITPVFPGKTETRSTLHIHALIFAFGLAGRNCDSCGAKPIATAYQCKKCNYDLCADCYDRTRSDYAELAAVVTFTPEPSFVAEQPLPVKRAPSASKPSPAVPVSPPSGFGDAAGARVKSTQHSCLLTYAIAVSKRNCDGWYVSYSYHCHIDI